MSKIINYIKNNKHIWLVLYVPVYLICFFIVERCVTDNFWVVYSPIDDMIPFCEYFIIPYVLWYPAMFITGIYLLVKDVPAFKRYMYFIIFGFSIVILFCILVPNCQLLRPKTFENNNIFTKLVRLIYSADTNTNVFPSMHVVGSAAVLFGVFDCITLKKKVYIRIAIVILTTLISISTVFVKQHSIIDTVCAVPYSVILYLVIYVVIPKIKLKHYKSSD